MTKIDQIKDLLKNDPTDGFLQHALALEYVKLADDETAKKVFENLLQQDPAYIGSYYHLAKLLERQGLNDEAILIYEKGMTIAKKLGEQHALSELRSAYEDLTF